MYLPVFSGSGTEVMRSFHSSPSAAAAQAASCDAASGSRRTPRSRRVTVPQSHRATLCGGAVCLAARLPAPQPRAGPPPPPRPTRAMPDQAASAVAGRGINAQWLAGRLAKAQPPAHKAHGIGATPWGPACRFPVLLSLT